MNVIADTNILVRAITEDDPVQTRVAQKLLKNATVVAVPITALAEFCWVMQRLYKYRRSEIAAIIRTLVAAENAAIDNAAVDAGLAMLDGGGDFADGAIAHAGKWLGAETFMSFDKEAVRLLKAQGQDARVPA